MSSIVYAEKIATSNLAKVVSVCEQLNVNPNWLMGVMNFETGGTFSPSVTNSIGSVGLIQFTRDKAGVEYKTIGNKKYYLADIKKMTFSQQMDLVYLYLKPYENKIKSFIDLYLVVFFPAAIGKPLTYVLETKNLSASIIAKQNPAFNQNKDGKITKAEVLEFFKKKYKEFPKINEGSDSGLVYNFKSMLTELGIIASLGFYVALSF